ncbi:MAG: DUF4136 domain-containing protein [Gammaproteobacteria bacterium]|nr:DUF4136 domain-containing protein [Gammaproteobacteria bacterium]
MKNIMRLSWVVFILIYVQACSGIKVSQDYEQVYNFSALKTFAWKPNNDNEYGLKDNELVDKRIRTAIVDQLSAKSYTLINSATPDFFISYNITVEQKITSSGASSSISIGRSSYGRYGGVGMSTGSQVRAYDQGTLLIDVTIPLADKLVWRGISTQSVSEHSSPEESTANINETVEKILAQFPPGK